ncbi:hypothetical protein K488DRAFT_65515, partial [Vararia minispora EC-137]
KQHGVRWTEFVRLHYFDPIRMTIIDPMHCMLLGLGKNQWFSRWIQTGALRSDTEAGTQRELHDFHAFMDTVEIPSWAGHLPRGVGNPAGGSLSADEYKVLLTCIAVMVMPTLWEHWHAEQDKGNAAAQERYERTTARAQRTYVRRAQDRARAEQRPVPSDAEAAEGFVAGQPPKLDNRISANESELTLLLASAMKTYFAHRITDTYGVAAMKPNMHFVVHMPDQARDYGPLPGIWAFASERLNKTLKNFNNNFWDAGRMEGTMMRAEGRRARLLEMVSRAPALCLPFSLISVEAEYFISSDRLDFRAVGSHMLKEDQTQQVHGTVQDASAGPGMSSDGE